MIIISSCGGGNSVVKKTTGMDALISDVHPISNAERNIATRICYAYQSKSKNFRSSEFIGTNFVFSGKKTDCLGVVTNFITNTELQYDTSNALTYTVLGNLDPNFVFSKKVQTDSSGYLSQLCPKIINNEPISNTIDQSGVSVQISFFHDGLDSYLIQYFNQQPDSSFKLDSAEKLAVRTQNDFTTGKILGMDEAYTYQKVCGSQFDKNRFSESSQNFSSN